MAETYDYTAIVAQFDLSTRAGVGALLQWALRKWRDDELSDLQMDELLARCVSALCSAQQEETST